MSYRKKHRPAEQAGRSAANVRPISGAHRASRHHHANHRPHGSRPSCHALPNSHHVTRSIRGRRRTSLSRATTARSSFGHYIPSTKNHHRASRCTHVTRCIRAMTRRSCLRYIPAIRCSPRTLRRCMSGPSIRRDSAPMNSYAMQASLRPKDAARYWAYHGQNMESSKSANATTYLATYFEHS